MEHDKLWIKMFLATKQFSKMPKNPKAGKWYRIYLEDGIDSTGKQTYVSIKLGTVNKLVVDFQGGGACWDQYTAARPIGLDYDGPENFYVYETEPLSDYATAMGMGSMEERNPFKDWTIVTINYTTGDWHVGDGEFPYTSLSGEEKILHHHGYRNFLSAMQAVKPYVGEPESLLVAGGSAGGFGAAALAGEVREMFPHCADVSCLVDGSFLLKDWQPVLDVWKTPEHIAKKIKSRNYSLNLMEVLHREHPEIRQMFVSSLRDGELAKYQSFMDGKPMDYTRESGEKYQKDLQEHLEQLKKAVPEIRVYLFDLPYPDKDPALKLTQHTLIQSVQFYEMDDSMAQWAIDCMNGNGKDHLI